MTDPSSHPYAHVEAALRYEWMRQDCAAFASARQSREDGLIQTITQISSAAVLAIPGFLLSSEIEVPSFSEGLPLYAGTTTFMLALIASMLEQHFSAQSYRSHEAIAKSYYFLDSDKNCDQDSIDRVDMIRTIACVLFGVALLLSAIGLASLMGNEHDKPAATGTAAPTTSATAAPTSATASPSTSATTASPAAAIARLRRQGYTEVGTVTNSAATKEVVVP